MWTGHNTQGRGHSTTTTTTTIATTTASAVVAAAAAAATYIVPSLLDRVDQPVKVGAERLQAGRIQEEAALAGGVRGGAAGIAGLLAGGNLLLEESGLARVEAQFRHWDGGHVHIIQKS